MGYLYNYKIRKNIMGLLLLIVILFGTYAVFADTLLKDVLGGKSSGFWIDIAPFSGYVALGAILLYIPLNILDKKLYEKALKEHRDKGNS